MTIRLPEKTIADFILSLIGKRRLLVIPSSKEHGELEPYVNQYAKWESFCSALFRAKKEPIPKGLFDPDNIKK